ncbi:MAG: S9 family peptidase [Vicinamibacterales bacterium]|nr:S9 family peptidase [Vicinamibacterales bacterium]
MFRTSRLTHAFAPALAVALVAASTLTAVAQEAFTPHHVAKIRTVAAVAPSPDGSEVAYVLAVPRIPFQDDDGAAWTELHVVKAGGASRPYVTGAVNVGGVRWTPDGRGLAFLARRAGDDARSLHVVPRDGGEGQRVLAHATDIAAFEFSPDGRQVAFLAREAPSKERQDLARRGFTQEIFEETLQPLRVWIAPLDGLTAGAARLVDLPGAAAVVGWNAAGTQLVVLYAPTALVDDDLMQRRIHIVDAARGTLVTKIDNPGKIGQVGFSPDGTTIATVSAADINDPSEGRLMVAPAGGGALRDLMPDYEAHVRAFAWRDADTLVYMSEEGVSSVVGEVRKDGTGRRTIVAAGGPIITAMERARNGAVALLAHTPAHPAEVFLLESGATTPARLTRSNPWLDTMRLARQEVVRFKARDGLDLEGILVRPLDEQAGQRYPLILTVHGGPEARDANGWVTSYANAGQVGAAQGFAVFYPNYRGSTGRGVAFSKLGQADPAGKEFDDLVDAVDHLVTTGLVDRAKVGITGGSYGGYASAWGASYYTERFAASVMFVGISNKVSKIGTTDIANEEYYVHARKRVWDDWQFALDRSPVYHAAKSRTPTLILHGTADPRVHPTQSLEFYRHLKLHGNTPVRLVWYPGEGHGNARAASRLDYSLRLMQWMTHYLKGPGGPPPPHELDYREPAATPPTAARQ